MGVSGLVLAVVFGGMTLAILVDRLGAARGAPAAAGAAANDGPASLARAPVPDPAGAGRQLRRFPELAQHAQGWALITAGSTVVATDTPAAALLLARACTALTDVHDGPAAQAAWRSMRLQGEAGLLLAETGRGEARLAVLARPGAPEAEVRAAMGHALERVAQHQGDDRGTLDEGDAADDAAGLDP